MNMQELEARIKELAQAIEQSMANHNALIGRIEEAKFILSELEKVAEVVQPV